MENKKLRGIKIQLELSDDENLRVELFKLKYKLKDKREAIKEMLMCFDIDFDILLKRNKPKWK